MCKVITIANFRYAVDSAPANGTTYRSASETVHVYIGGAAGSGARAYGICADKERKDVGSIEQAGDFHGYDDIIPTALRGEQEVYIYAIDTGSNQPNILLGHKTVTIEEPESLEEHVHAYTKEITKQASCTEQGERRCTCTCGDSYCEVIEKLPHTEVNIPSGRRHK